MRGEKKLEDRRVDERKRLTLVTTDDDTMRIRTITYVVRTTLADDANERNTYSRRL